MPRRLLFVASRPGIAGGERYLFDVLRYLDSARYVPIVAVPARGALSETLGQRGIETFIMDVDYGWLRPPQVWYPFLVGFEARVRRLVDFMRERGVDLVHTNSNQVFEGAVAARVAGLHHVHVVHIPFHAHLPIYQRLPIDAPTFAAWVGALSAAVVAVSEPVAASLCPPLSRAQVSVIHNGIDLAPFRTARPEADGRVRRELGIPPGAPLVAGVGRLHPDKGFDTFIDAAAVVRRAVPDVRFVIAGAADSVEHEAALRQRVAQRGLDDCLFLLGPRDDVPAILAETDVFLLTSRSEGGPYVLLEAAASGCACVASRCGGFVEHLVRPGQSGWLFDPGDSAAAASHVTEALRNHEDRARCVGGVQEIVYSGEFEVGRSVQRLSDLYESVLSLPPPDPGSALLTLLLQAMREIGSVGDEVTQLRERVKRAERASELIFDNRLARWLRRILKSA